MLKTLRYKFIALNMGLAALVLAVAFGAICIIDHHSQVEKLYSSLNSMIERGPIMAANSQIPDEFPDIKEAEAPQIGKRGDKEPVMPVAIYMISNQGTYSSMDAFASAAISSNIESSAIDSVYNSSAAHGYLADAELYYAKHTTPVGVIVAYADSSMVSPWQSLALTLAGIGALVLIAFFVINLFFSRWALRPVEEAWVKQQQFVADASHELKTPLTVILANMAILKKRAGNTVGEQLQWVESTRLEAQRMQDLVNDLLSLARFDGERDAAAKKAGFERIDLTRLVSGLVLQFESITYEKSVEVEEDVCEGACVLGDTESLRRLVSTLLDNACKYVDRGGTIRVSLRRAAKGVVLAVSNSGDPIPQGDIPHVFDRFYRADAARTGSDHSFGLGLAIAKEIAEAHGGSIDVSSSAEHGTSFVVKLPANADFIEPNLQSLRSPQRRD